MVIDLAGTHRILWLTLSPANGSLLHLSGAPRLGPELDVTIKVRWDLTTLVAAFICFEFPETLSVP